MTLIKDLVTGAVESQSAQLLDGFNSTKIDIKEPRVDGTSVYLDFEAEDGGDITFCAGGRSYTYNCTTNTGPGGIGSVELTQGTSEEPTWQFIYMSYSESAGTVIAISSLRIPKDTLMGPVAYGLIPPYSEVTATGPTMIQRITDIPSDGYRSADSHLREKVRLALMNNRITGGEIELQITTNAGSRDNIDILSQIVQFYQLHEQEMGAQQASVDNIRMVGQDVGECTIGNYAVITDLGSLTETGDGTTIASGETVIIDIIGIGCSCELPMLGAIVSKSAYSSAVDAIHDAKTISNLRYPKDIDQVCFTLARLVLTYTSADNGTWTNALSPTAWVWKSETITEATPSYPYYNNNTHEYFGTTHTKTGAIYMRCHFRDFITEANYDYVRLKNSGGTTIVTYHGNLGAFTSSNISGDTIRFYFDSDGSVIKVGAYIDKIDWYIEVPTGGGETLDRR